MPMVNIRDSEPFDVALRRFKRSCEKAGTLSDLRRREFYEKPTWVRKRKVAAAVKRWQKKLSKEQEAIDRRRTQKRRVYPTDLEPIAATDEQSA